MSELKIAKASKSKSSNNNEKSTKLASQSSFKSSSGTIKPPNVPLAKKQSKTPGSILSKLDLECLKDTALKKMRTGAGFPSVPGTREACIEFALDMVIENLIKNGHLRAKKAQKIRSPLMTAQIAMIVDDMISANTEITRASTAKPFRGRKKSSKSSSKSTSRSRSRSQQTQKWAIQPAALPITIVTDHQSLTKLPKFTTLEKIQLSAKETGSKSSRKASTDNVKKQKSTTKPKNRTKSLDSSSERNNNIKQASQPSVPPPPTQNERQTSQYLQQASSEVPSNHSFDTNSKRLSNTSSNVPADNPNSNTNMEQQTTGEEKGEKAPESKKQVKDINENGKPAPTSENRVKFEDNNKIKEAEDAGYDKAQATNQNLPQASVDRNQILTPLPVTSPPRPRTLNTLLGNPCISASSTTLSAFQTKVDMKGFQNDEISMEVEGRQLIFLASRAKRDELNVRKVTEIVEIPASVKMENLKIGRRTDGYVIIEEHDS